MLRCMHLGYVTYTAHGWPELNFFETLLTRRATSSGRSGGRCWVMLFEPRMDADLHGWAGFGMAAKGGLDEAVQSGEPLLRDEG